MYHVHKMNQKGSRTRFKEWREVVWGIFPPNSKKGKDKEKKGKKKESYEVQTLFVGRAGEAKERFLNHVPLYPLNCASALVRFLILFPGK